MFVVASTLASAWAAGPFEVRRGLVTVDVSVVTTAPFDESALRSHDASNYFYAVFDAGGKSVFAGDALDARATAALAEAVGDKAPPGCVLR